MPGFLLHLGAIVMCPHGGQIMPIPNYARVFTNGQPLVTIADQYVVVGCPLSPPPALPCLTADWIVPSLRISVNGQPVILQDSTGICLNASMIPQGDPIVVQTQVQVRGI